MNRTEYFNYIEKKLVELATRIKIKNKLNTLELNLHSETFFANLYNLVFDLELTNLNLITRNAEGIDLIDKKNKILIQVSSTCDKNKIKNSLNKKIYNKYTGYKFRFLSTTDEVKSTLKNNNFENPYGLSFNPKEDIWDNTFLLNHILHKNIDKQKELYDYIKKELSDNLDYIKTDSNLANIINILAEENLNFDAKKIDTQTFIIEEKISFNNLNGVKEIINDYKIFSAKLDEKYKEFDVQGKNKSFSVLQAIRKQYIQLKEEIENQNTIFYKIIENIIKITMQSSNYIPIPFEELELCVNILVVDAFIRCKIFENPEGYNYAIT